MPYMTPTLSANYVWNIWCGNTTWTGSTLYPHSNANQVWQTWVNTAATSTQIQAQYTYVDEAWQTWTYNPNQAYMTVTPPSIRTQAETERRTLARARARTLLDGFLDDDQRHDLEHKGQFHVTGSRGRRYCIRAAGQSGNVALLKEDGSVQATLCAHPRSAHDRHELLPEGDAWLAQMLELETDEDHFLAMANVHGGHLPPEVAALRGRLLLQGRR